jgi:hypothetical protein
LPPAKGAENLFSKAISNMERDLLPLDSRKEVYRDECFETISNYPNASASFYRDTFPPGEEGDEEWRKLCEMYGEDPNVDNFFAANAPTFLPKGATKSPPSPLTELIALYILANEPLEPLLGMLHPNPAEVKLERLDQAVEELWHKAGQLATLVRGGIIRRGPSTEEITPPEQNLARYISSQLLQGVPEAEIREFLKKRGYSQAEFTRLKNLKLDPFP